MVMEGGKWYNSRHSVRPLFKDTLEDPWWNFEKKQRKQQIFEWRRPHHFIHQRGFSGGRKQLHIISQGGLLTRYQFHYLGFGRAARAGSCALVSVVHGGKLYCGNAGDSLGIVVEEASPMGYTPINRFLNADNPEEQKRLSESFPQEEDIFICKRPNNTSCYVKGRLQPTRSIGDLRLKLA